MRRSCPICSGGHGQLADCPGRTNRGRSQWVTSGFDPQNPQYTFSRIPTHSSMDMRFLQSRFSSLLKDSDMDAAAAVLPVLRWPVSEEPLGSWPSGSPSSSTASAPTSPLTDLELVFQHGRERRKAFRTGQIVGSGTEATVKIATCLATGARVAIKVIRKPVSTSSPGSAHSTSGEMRRKFEAVTALPHPNLLKHIEYFETKDKFYLVTELLAGDLHTLLAQNGGKLSEDQARVVLEGILQGLQFLHSKGIAHR